MCRRRSSWRLLPEWAWDCRGDDGDEDEDADGLGWAGGLRLLHGC